MNLAELQTKLIAAARARVPGDQVPYAFEKRVTALLASRVAPENMNQWVSGLWRAAISCVAISLVLGALVFFGSSPAPAANDLSLTFEQTLLASVGPSDQAQ